MSKFGGVLMQSLQEVVVLFVHEILGVYPLRGSEFLPVFRQTLEVTFWQVFKCLLLVRQFADKDTRGTRTKAPLSL